jgi:hypothetical protein
MWAVRRRFLKYVAKALFLRVTRNWHRKGPTFSYHSTIRLKAPKPRAGGHSGRTV